MRHNLRRTKGKGDPIITIAAMSINKIKLHCYLTLDKKQGETTSNMITYNIIV